MSPYRTPQRPAELPADETRDERAIGVVLVGAGSVPVIATLCTGGAFGGGATCALILVVLGVRSLRCSGT